MQVAEKIDNSLIEDSEITAKKGNYELYKRVFDLCFAILLLPFLIPLMALIAILIKFDSRGPVFFAHRRIGKDGISFHCYKFRTMVQNADQLLSKVLQNEEAQEEWKKDFKLREDPRITRIGKFLRRSSLDELPQIFNVFLGNMSFVGPRPIVAAEVKRYGKDFIYYTAVKPGITGLWQVSGRNDTDYKMRIALDREYSSVQSVKEDIKIIIKTIPTVFTKKGAY